MEAKGRELRRGGNSEGGGSNGGKGERVEERREQ